MDRTRDSGSRNRGSNPLEGALFENALTHIDTVKKIADALGVSLDVLMK